MSYELQASAHATQLGNSLPILTLLIQIVGLVCFAHIVYSAFRRCGLGVQSFACLLPSYIPAVERLYGADRDQRNVRRRRRLYGNDCFPASSVCCGAPCSLQAHTVCRS